MEWDPQKEGKVGGAENDLASLFPDNGKPFFPSLAMVSPMMWTSFYAPQRWL